MTKTKATPTPSGHNGVGCNDGDDAQHRRWDAWPLYPDRREALRDRATETEVCNV